MKAPFLIGRLVFGGFFFYNGINHLVKREQMAQYAAAKGVPRADVAIVTTGAMLVFGGTSIMLGVLPKLGTAAIAAFLGGVTPTIHNFWAIEDPNQRMAETVNFGKNLALFGADLALMSLPEPWRASVPLAQPSRLQRIKAAARRRLAA
ncbi:MAG TPA: DoxX family protein [Terriglobales bacterium]|nr:DoxX family protein [Terriglobales bacterium]